MLLVVRAQDAEGQEVAPVDGVLSFSGRLAAHFAYVPAGEPLDRCEVTIEYASPVTTISADVLAWPAATPAAANVVGPIVAVTGETDGGSWVVQLRTKED